MIPSTTLKIPKPSTEIGKSWRSSSCILPTLRIPEILASTNELPRRRGWVATASKRIYFILDKLLFSGNYPGDTKAVRRRWQFWRSDLSVSL